MNLCILLAVHIVSMDTKAGALYVSFLITSFIITAFQHEKKEILLSIIPLFLLATLLSIFAFQYSIVSYLGIFFGTFLMIGITYFEKQKPGKS